MLTNTDSLPYTNDRSLPLVFAAFKISSSSLESSQSLNEQISSTSTSTSKEASWAICTLPEVWPQPTTSVSINNIKGKDDLIIIVLDCGKNDTLGWPARNVLMMLGMTLEIGGPVNIAALRCHSIAKIWTAMHSSSNVNIGIDNNYNNQLPSIHPSIL